MNKLEKWIAGGTLATIIVGLVVQQFWFVPYYIESKVNQRVDAKLSAAGLSTIDDTADGNKAMLGAVLMRLDSMEGRMIARDQLFFEYLDRQAN